jgi:predicted metal-dependent hydrolase
MGRAPGTVPYLGKMLQLVPEPGRERVARRADTLYVPEGDPRPALERWYRRQARTEVARRLDATCARVGSSYKGLTIRGQKTRWASCSSSGAMSFNWRLLLAPPEILDYVIEHEVAHIEVMDHSPRFRRLLASRSPRWREHSAWLKRYGSTLTL